ncbi:MAG: hypothetical protein PHE43_00845 [Candidatus Nanoarchaeia archaeon]|nr:hypothetical protein [Candidatus Nanoarchaeia archaeon]
MKKIRKVAKKVLSKRNRELAKRAAKITVREVRRVAPKARREVEKIYHFGKSEAKKIIIEIKRSPKKKKKK